MAQRNSPPLKFGGANVRAYGKLVGQVSNAQMSMTNQKLEHSTNFAPRYRKDAIFAIMSAVTISWRFEHILPSNANLMLGSPGFSLPSLDPKLAGMRPQIGLFTNLPLTETERPVLTDSTENRPEWSPLLYPMANPNATYPAPPTGIFAQDVSTPGAIIGYRGFAAALMTGAVPLGPPVILSIPSNVAITPIFGASDIVNVTVTWDTAATVTGIQLYQFSYTYNATYDTYIGTYVAANVVDEGLPSYGYFTTSGGEQAAGSKTMAVDISVARLTQAGHPIMPITVTNIVSGAALAWLTDFEFQPLYLGGSAIKRVPTGAIAVDTPVVATYYYEAGDIVEAPIGSNTTNNPIIPIVMDSLFPDGVSKIILKLWAVQSLPNQLSMPFSPTDWMGLDFVGEALDRGNVYANYPFGQMQFTGPMAQRVKQRGNFQWGDTLYPVGENQTSWA